jgi:UDP-N-acetylmuramoyl-L-alanyl-D-glutamate--2,6-diaminopimelate ligase
VSTLAQLIDGLGATVHGDAAVDVGEICYDSRRAQPGSLFVALRGHLTDGHRYTGDALAAGASALLVEEEPADRPAVPVVVVPDTRAVLPVVAARHFEHPARDLKLVGVTGTNGKTSTVRMIESILRQADIACGSIGTISVRYADVEETTDLTTPESVDLQRTLAAMRDAGVRCVALEVSSHSLALGRVGTLRFAVAVYTQLSQDHLDFHEDLEAYGETKARLFGPEYLAGTAVLNAHDALTPRLAELARGAGHPVMRYARGKATPADLQSVDEDVTLAGSRFRVETADGPLDIVLPLPGDFQIENALAAIGTALALELPMRAIRDGLAQCPPVPGRLERVAPELPAVFVDYAHTPDALDRVLARVRPLVSGRLICVFGCGGDRDKSKRAPMARAACAHADLAIATSDNPRSEDPEAILRDVAEGLSGQSEIVVDRRAAIERAVSEAAPDDVVVIAGKGHEDYQLIGNERRSFDDRVEARRALEARR